jgi:hypothetical protein
MARFPRSGSKSNLRPQPSRHVCLLWPYPTSRVTGYLPTQWPAPDPFIGITPRAPLLHRHYIGFIALTNPCADPGISLPLGFMRPCGAGLFLADDPRTFPALMPQPSQSAAPLTPGGLREFRPFVLPQHRPSSLRSRLGPTLLSRNTILPGGTISARQVFLYVAALWFACPPDRSQSPVALVSGEGLLPKLARDLLPPPELGTATRSIWTPIGVGLTPTG